MQAVLLQPFVKHGSRQIQLLHSFLPISSALSQYLLDKALFLLSQVLPQAVDQMTPQGRLPDDGGLGEIGAILNRFG